MPSIRISPGAIGRILPVGVAEIVSGTVGHQEFHIRKRLMLIVIADLRDQQRAQGRIAEAQRHHVLVLAGDIDGLGFRINDVAVRAFQFLTDICALTKSRNSKGAIGRRGVGSDHRAAGTGCLAAEITQFKARSFEGGSCL